MQTDLLKRENVNSSSRLFLLTRPPYHQLLKGVVGMFYPGGNATVGRWRQPTSIGALPWVAPISSRRLGAKNSSSFAGNAA